MAAFALVQAGIWQPLIQKRPFPNCSVGTVAVAGSGVALRYRASVRRPNNLRLMDNARRSRKRPFGALFLSKNSSSYQRPANGTHGRIWTP